jgi:hypothetical protein
VLEDEVEEGLISVIDGVVMGSCWSSLEKDEICLYGYARKAWRCLR